MQLADLAVQINRSMTARASRLVGIDGLGGSGKSTLAEALRRRLPQPADVVHLDDFYRPSDVRPKVPLDSGDLFDWRRLREEVLEPVQAGEMASYRRFDWASDSIDPRPVSLPGIGSVVVEGVGVLRRELREMFGARLFVDCPRDVRLARGLARDGQDARSVWVDLWMPAEDRYLRAHRPDDAADLVASGDGPDPVLGTILVERGAL
jgi:uridine kinase